MEERKNAEQAYKDALTKMSMPAIFDADKEMFSNGRSGIKMKSRVLAYAAAAAVLAVCIGIGAIVINARSGDVRTSPGVDSGLHLEEDQTLPSGEIKSIEQAVEEHRKCLLLINDEYIKLKKSGSELTPEAAESFSDRMNKLNERDGECIEYIRANADKNEPLFIHAIKYDDGSIDLSFRLSNMLRRVRQEMQGLEDNDPVYYICDAKSGEKLVKCVTRYGSDYMDVDTTDKYGVKLDKTDLEKLKGELSFVAFGSGNKEQSFTVIKKFSFFDKSFVSASERERLDFKADNILKQNHKVNAKDYKNSVKMTLDKYACSQHGMYMRISLTPANYIGREQFRKMAEDGGESEIFVRGDSETGEPKPDVKFGKIIMRLGWYTELVSSSEDKLIYDCYLPITCEVDKEFGMTVYAMITSPDLSDDEIINGEFRGTKLGSLKVRYEDPMKERTFVCGDKKIMLSDLCLGISDTADKVTEITFKKDDGSQEKLTEKDFAHCSIVEYGDEDEPDVLYKRFTKIAAPEDFRANFITKSVDTSHVTSIVYAGQEYKTESEKIKSIDEARKLYSQSYEAQNKIIERYRTEADKHENDKQEFCTGLWNEYDELEKKINEASRYIGLYSDSCIWVNKTTAGTMQFTLWYNKKTIMSRYAKVVISLDKEGKNIVAEGAPTVDFASFQGDLDGYRGLTVKLNGDLNVIKKDQLYYVTFTVDGRQMTRSFTVTADKPEMTSLERSSVLSDINLEARGKKPVSS